MNGSGTVQQQFISDEEIVVRVTQGEKDLYEKIIRKYNQRMYRIGMSIVNDPEEVEEIMQSAYIKAYEHLPEFQFKSAFSTWLTRILINESLRVKKRKQQVQVFDGSETQTEDMPEESPIQKVMNKELRTILEKSLEQLPEKYRLVFIMREVEDMSIHETMDCLHLSESNVKVRLNRAKEMLRDSISHHYKTEELYDFHLSRCDRIVKNVMDRIRG
jgi:RNA polymerase sigma-70 factor (ECF subfamily)